MKLKRKILFVAVASLFAEGALAQVVLPTISGTNPDVSVAGSKMTVDQGTAQRKIYDWTSFNITGTGAWVDFKQPNATAIAVNRISGGMSTIDGKLTASGHVMLLNQNGVLFGSNAVVNVGSLTASTGSLAGSDSAFLNGTGPVSIVGAAAGRVEVASGGKITVAETGLVALVAPSVINSGVITATKGRIVLASAEEATVTLNVNNLYELAVTKGFANGTVTNAGTLAATDTGGTILVSALDVANALSGVINLNGVQQATRIEVNGGVVELTKDLEAGTVAGASRTVNVYNGAQIQDAVNIAATSASVNVGAGTYAEQIHVNKAGLTMTGAAGAKVTVADGPSVDGVTIEANNVTVSGFEIAGPVTSSYLTYPWGANISRGIAVANGVTGFAITNNNIHDVRNGILIDGRNTGTVTNNRIENTKSGVSVNYTDASGITISGNSEGPIGNEWGVNLHLNGYFDAGGVHHDNPLAAAPTLTWQQALLDLSAANSGWSVQDQGYTSSNRTRANVATTGSSSNQGSPLAPLNTIQGGINAVVPGGTVNVGSGTYAENLSIGKALTLTGAGAGNSIVDPVSSDALSIGGNMGTNSTLVIDGFTFRDAPRYGVKVAGDAVPGSTILGELIIRNSDFVRNGQNGLAVLGDATAGVPGVRKVTLENDNFIGNGTATASSLGYGDILFNYYNGDATFQNLRITGEGEFIGIQVRGRSLNPTQPIPTPMPSGTIQFDNVTIDGSFRRPDVPNSNPTWHNVGTWNPGGPGDAIHLLEYSSVTNVSFNDVVINLDVGHGMFLEGLGTTLNIGNTTFGLNTNLAALGSGDRITQKEKISRNIFIGSNDNHLVTNVDASQASFTDAAGSGFAIEDRVYHALDVGGLGLVTWTPGNVYVTAESGSVQRGVDAASVGGTVNVANVNFAEDVVVGQRRNLLFNGSRIGSLTLLAGAGGSGLGGAVTASGQAGFVFNAPVSLLGPASLAATAGGIALNGDLQGNYDLSLSASGDVSLVSGGSQTSPLGKLTASGGNFTLSGTLWVTGYDIDALGAVALNGHTLNSTGGASGTINAGGDVTGHATSDGPVSIDTTGSVSLAIDTSAPLEIHADGPASVTGSAPVLVIDAPSGSASGSFGQVTNVGGGLIEVNGKPQPNVSIAENTANNNRVVPADITTGADAPGQTSRDEKRRRRQLKDAAEVLQNGEALEIDLSPSND